MKTEKLQEIRKLRVCAAETAGFWTKWETKYLPDSNCDKKRASFVSPDERFSAFSFKLTFDAHAGYYGNSSCSRIFGLDNSIAHKYFTLAIQEMARPLFQRASELMLKDAAELVAEAESEVSAIQAMLDEVKSVAVPDASEMGN